MLATTGFFSPSLRISRHIRSDASASPPGESTRSTTPAHDLSLASRRSIGMTASAVMAPPVPDDFARIAPEVRRTTMRFLPPLRPNAPGFTWWASGRMHAGQI
eukprot:357392-Chlamydomonas_euryale.AAC.32